MSLRARLHRDAGAVGQDRPARLYGRFGLTRNPFPPAGEPSGNPHLPTHAEERLTDAVVAFDRDRTSQVFIIEGTQGVGKTNLLSHFQAELQDAYRDDVDVYIIRYYPDPESSFDGILRRLFQEFGVSELIGRIAEKLKSLSTEERDHVIEIAGGHDMRLVLHALARTAMGGQDLLAEAVALALDWLGGLRMVKRQREVLGVQFRLDTVESKTQALHDLVFVASRLELLKGLFLLLDELEKHDYAVSKVVVLRYLSAVRALIDALPRHLFLLVALTTEARRRYFEMLPAFAGRLQNIVTLEPLKTVEEAIAIADFYIEQAKASARRELGSVVAGSADVLTRNDIRQKFAELYSESADRGLEGVTHRDFLNALHVTAEPHISNA